VTGLIRVDSGGMGTLQDAKLIGSAPRNRLSEQIRGWHFSRPGADGEVKDGYYSFYLRVGKGANIETIKTVWNDNPQTLLHSVSVEVGPAGDKLQLKAGELPLK
jgi:hypothetical protein